MKMSNGKEIRFCGECEFYSNRKSRCKYCDDVYTGINGHFLDHCPLIMEEEKNEEN